MELQHLFFDSTEELSYSSRVISSGFIRFKRQALQKSVSSLVFILAVETHAMITGCNCIDWSEELANNKEYNRATGY